MPSITIFVTPAHQDLPDNFFTGIFTTEGTTAHPPTATSFRLSFHLVSGGIREGGVGGSLLLTLTVREGGDKTRQTVHGRKGET